MTKSNQLYLSCALITDHNNQMLTVRKKNSIYYMMAGGKINSNETPQQALKRELFEELNICIDFKELTYLGTHTTRAANEENTIVNATIYHLKTAHLDIKPYAELEEVCWLNYTTYTNYPLAHLLKEFSIPFWLQLNNI